MADNKTITVSLSINKNLSRRMDKYITNKSTLRSNLTAHLTPYQFKYYKSIERGNRSYVFSEIIKDFLCVLEKDNGIGIIFCSKGEFIRNAITYNIILKRIDERIIMLNDNPNGSNINGNIPIGNIYYPDGEWKNHYEKQDILRYDFLEKIYEKVHKFFSKRQIVSNFEKFYRAYKDGWLDNPIETEQQIRKLKILIRK